MKKLLQTQIIQRERECDFEKGQETDALFALVCFRTNVWKCSKKDNGLLVSINFLGPKGKSIKLNTVTYKTMLTWAGVGHSLLFPCNTFTPS